MVRFLSLLLMCWSTCVQAQQTSVAQPPSSTTLTGVVPHLIRFSGILKDLAGSPRTGVVGVTFALYKDQEGGAALWLETQNVQADSKGNYRTFLGSTKPERLAYGVVHIQRSALAWGSARRASRAAAGALCVVACRDLRD
jgi:hypothetical protein